MILRTVKLIQKNHIIFNHNGNDYYQTIDNDNKINIFNQNLMNVFLEQFEETIGKVTYHDITQISVLENHCKEIKNLPNKLKMVGIIEGVQVGFSQNEELQLEFGKIMVKFNSNEYSFEQAYCQAKSILEFVENGIKESWLAAILDLRPDDTIIEFKNKQYFKTWDDDILDIPAKELIGYFMEEKIVFLDEL